MKVDGVYIPRKLDKLLLMTDIEMVCKLLEKVFTNRDGGIQTLETIGCMTSILKKQQN